MPPQRPTGSKPLPVAPSSAAGPHAGAADLCEVRCIDAPTVTRVRAEMPSGGAVALAAERLKLLGDPTRLRLLAALARAEELCVCDLTLIVGYGGGPSVSESAVSHALRALRLVGAVTFRKQSKVAYYRLADAATRQLVMDLFAAGSPDQELPARREA
jgi:ArsR family transcriptional regulator, lead/cadmium/zinc/bismuth-responsive transcriptional repressor